MLESMSFTFNGISSEEKGVVIVNPDGGLYEDYFLPTREIIEEKTPYNPVPYFMGTDTEPLTFPITFWLKDWNDRNNLREVAEWLFQPYYCPMAFECSPEQIYYVMFVGESNRLHNGNKEGYVTLEVRCNSPFSYSHTRTHELSVRTVADLNINNDGAMGIYPRITLTKTVLNGNIAIENRAMGKSVILSDISKDEVIEIDFKTRDITSSLESQNIYRYDNHNDVWLEFLVGKNQLIFEGHFDIKIEYELMYITEDYPFWW